MRHDTASHCNMTQTAGIANELNLPKIKSTFLLPATHSEKEFLFHHPIKSAGSFCSSCKIIYYCFVQTSLCLF